LHFAKLIFHEEAQIDWID